jgi:hypothetical protein
VQSLRGKRKEGREHDLQVVDAAQRHVQDRSGTLPIARKELPGLLDCQVAVHERRETHRFRDSRSEPRTLNALADPEEAPFYFGDQRQIVR